MMSRRFAMVVMASLMLAACDSKSDPGFQGWVEADLLFIGPDEAGRIEMLAVHEGDAVAQGAPMFTVDSDLQRADLAQQQAALTNAQQAYDRAMTLLKNASGTQKAVEDAEAALRTAQARVNSSQTRLARRVLASPASGNVQQIYYRVGEMVPAGRPIVALLPPANVKIRFFVPEAALPKFAFGDSVNVSCDGCAPNLTAKISFISRASEFTPPVIYSLEERAKLVFMIEARPETPEKFRVGQPLTVHTAGAGQ